MIKLNSKAPKFCLLDSNESKKCLKDYLGRWVVLYFYPKDNTPGCTLEAITFTKDKLLYNKLGAVILGVSKDSCASHAKFVSKFKLDLELLSDPEHKVCEKFGAWQLKKFMGREFMGIVRSTVLISPDGKIVHHWPKVSAKGHSKEVLDTLKEKIKEKAV